MKEKKNKKTLLEPKVRLLLWMHLHKVKNESNYLSKLAKEIDYSKGSIQSYLITDLLNRNLIESLNVDKTSPPYRTTNEAKKFLEPIFLVTKIGYMFTGFELAMLGLLLAYYIDKPSLLVTWWLPSMISGIAILTFSLILYPYLLIKLGKISY